VLVDTRADIDVPTLIPLSEAEVLLAGIKGAALVTIAGAAHLPNIERPEAFNAAMMAFLSGLAPVGS
jgi:pimeloyl-ACP methyl ester carboxylesterase